VCDPVLAQQEQEPVEPLRGWKLNHARKHPDEEGVAEIGYLDPEDDRFAPILTVDTGLYYQDAQALPLAVAILSMLSTHPPRRETEQEPVAWIQPDHLQKARQAPFLCRVEPTKRMSDFVPIYTHPPRREWVSLTEEEIDSVMPYCHNEFDLAEFKDSARAIEAALKERNT
jgi:hypothetical protein